MTWLDNMVAEELTDVVWDEAAAATPPGDYPILPPGGRIPGKLVFQGSIEVPLPFQKPSIGSRINSLRLTGKKGFVYDLIDNDRWILDVGSAASKNNLIGRITTKRKKFPKLKWARVYHVNLTGSRLPWDRRLVVIHELWRKVNLAPQIRNYDRSKWYFDESL